MAEERGPRGKRPSDEDTKEPSGATAEAEPGPGPAPKTRSAAQPDADDEPVVAEEIKRPEAAGESPWAPPERDPGVPPVREEPDAEEESTGPSDADWSATLPHDAEEEEPDFSDWGPTEDPKRQGDVTSNVPSLDEPRRGWSVAEPGAHGVAGGPSPSGPRDRLAAVREREAAGQRSTELRSRWEGAARVRGSGPWSAVGWAVLLIGLALLAYAYYELYMSNADSVLDVAGVVRLDVLGAFLMIVGGIVAGIFYATPAPRFQGPTPEADPDDWVRRADRYETWERTHRSLAGVGSGLVVLGLLIGTIVWFASWRNSTATFVEYGVEVGGAFYLYWRMALLLTVVGAVLMAVTYPRIRNAREARKAWLLAALEAADADRRAARAAGARTAGPSLEATTAAPVETGVAGVPPEEIRRLMRRIDELLSRLPDADVAEFAKSREAEAYLKILEDK